MNDVRIFNCSEIKCEFFPYATLVFSSITLLACVFGAAGNAFSFVIYSSRPMRTSSINSLLAGLSAVDFFLTTLAVPVFVLPGLNFYLNDPLLTKFYVVVTCVLYQCLSTMQTCSCWTFVLISIERYVAVCLPLRVKQILSVNRARFAQSIVVVSAFLYNSVRFFEYEPDADVSVRKLLLNSRSYFLFYYVCSYLLTHCFGPFVIILVLNLLILRTIKKHSETKEVSTARKSRQQRQQAKTTRMIVVVTSLFAVCNTLPYVISIWEAVEPDLFDIDDTWSHLASFVLDASNTLIVLNSSTTFLIYLCYCKKYRLLFSEYCLMSMRCRRSPTTYTRRFASFDSYFSNVDLYEFYTTVGGSSMAVGKSARSHSDITAPRDHKFSNVSTPDRSLVTRGYAYYPRKSGAYDLRCGVDHKIIERHSLQVPVYGKGSIVSTQLLYNGSIRAAILASRKSV